MTEYVEDFRRTGHELVDWIAAYLGNVRQYPVLAQTKPGELVDALPKAGPEQGESFEAILRDFESTVMPAVTHWNHPGFMAYFPSSSATPAILADLLASALNTNGILWKTSPAVSELEQVVMRWLGQWIGLPESFFGMIHDTASLSSLHALAAAREIACPEGRENGMPTGLTVYASEQAHSSIEKGAISLGMGRRNVRLIATDERFAMRPEALEEAIQADKGAGLRPICVVATVGTTSSTAVDPVWEIADIAERHGLWLHVDSAYAGSAAILPEFRQYFRGLERAQSFVMNPQKWLFTPVDCSAFYCSRPEILRRTFSMVPEYLRTTEDPRAVNFMEYGIPLGRRFRALKLWFLMRYLGHARITEILRSHVCWVQGLAREMEQHERFEVVAPTLFSLVCFRLKDSDEANRALLEKINASGRFFLSHTELNGRFVLRAVIGNIQTTEEDIQELWKLIQKCAGLS